MKTNVLKSILMLAVAALMLAVAPAGFGAISGEYLAPDDRPGLHGPGGIDAPPADGTADLSSATPSEPFVPGVTDFGRSTATSDLAPDDRTDLTRPGTIASTAGGSDDATAPTYVAVAVDGFDWGSAGIGAGAGAGMILAVFGAVLFVRSSRLRTQAG